MTGVGERPPDWGVPEPCVAERAAPTRSTNVSAESASNDPVRSVTGDDRPVTSDTAPQRHGAGRSADAGRSPTAASAAARRASAGPGSEPRGVARSSRSPCARPCPASCCSSLVRPDRAARSATPTPSGTSRPATGSARPGPSAVPTRGARCRRQPWRLHEWLPELLMSGVQQLARSARRRVAAPARRRRPSASPCGAPPAAGLAARLGRRASSPRRSSLSQSLSLRPHLRLLRPRGRHDAAWLRTADDGRARWWLVPLTWLWACSHGMWFVGVVIGVVALARARSSTGRARGRAWLRLALVPLASLAAAAADPDRAGAAAAPLRCHEYDPVHRRVDAAVAHRHRASSPSSCSPAPTCSSGRAQRRAPAGPTSCSSASRSASPCSTSAPSPSAAASSRPSPP